ncbi:hypothetical protein OG921_07735 [Aldersonia sp. NBC_00410]|uniref:hypothetical protein n=1 Tax=Aldersonia sp. NBC_00410 TaxID=2975954 RepID=UPI0022575EB1|nr:hypothetical protein [Aldersonia sp. NBC_00410]MCX5043058.1 hypothetical protein [Aldersonia sp. NBC_00410]
MRRNLFIRCVTAAVASVTVLLAAPAIAAAAPAPAQPVLPGVGFSNGIGHKAEAQGNSVRYTATGVPGYLGVFPGSCQTGLVNAVTAAPIIGGSIADLLAGNPFGLITALLESGSFVAFHPLVIADKDGTVTGTFANVPTGLYVVVSSCTAQATGPAYGATGVLVVGAR